MYKRQVSKYSSLHIIEEQSKLEAEFIKENNLSFRPKYWKVKNSTLQELRCGIFLGRKLVGGIKSTALDKRIESQPHMDGPVIEIFSTFLSKLLSKKEKSQSLNHLLQNISQSDKIDEADFLEGCHKILESNFASSVTLKTNSDGISMSFKPDKQTESLSISEADMRSILSTIGLKQDYINVNNDIEEIKKINPSNAKGLRKILNKINIRSLMIKKINKEKLILVGTYREKSFKRFFDREDKDNMAVLALLYKLKIA